jgi:CDP-glucose 4,6-dehydratase
VGGGDWAEDRIVPDCIRAFITNQPIIIRNPHAVRPWQHVLEPLSGYLWLGSLLLRHGKGFDDAWNFGPSPQNNKSVQEVVQQAISLWESGDWHVPDSPEKGLHESNYLRLDCSKSNNLLNWYPVYDFVQTFQTTVLWYKSFYNNSSDAIDLTLRDITDYTQAAENKGLQWTLY